MRFETHRVSEYVVEVLKRAAPVRAVTVDGGDIVEFVLQSGETVRLYLIESEITVYEIKGIVEPNSAGGIYTLFLLWCDMLLPGHGHRCVLEDWMAALLALYGDRIYAYEFNGPDVYLFPVYFDGSGYTRDVRFGRTVDPATLGCADVEATTTYFAETTRVAHFEAARGETRASNRYRGPAFLEAHYAALGLEAGATRVAVKRAYRRLALQFHPDLNPDPAAHARMQQINVAYEHILAALEENDE
jgi:hypothetical protein